MSRLAKPDEMAKENLYASATESLRAEVLDLMTRQVNFQQWAKEIAEEGSNKGQDYLRRMQANDLPMLLEEHEATLVSTLTTRAQIMSCPLRIMVTNYLSDMMLETLGRNNDAGGKGNTADVTFVLEKHRNVVYRVIDLARAFKKQGNFDSSMFMKKLTLLVLPLEVIWQFHIHKINLLSQYLNSITYEQTNKRAPFLESLEQVSYGDHEIMNPLAKKILLECMQEVISIGFSQSGSSLSQNVIKVAEYIVKKLTHKAMDVCWSKDVSNLCNFDQVLLDNETMDKAMLKKYSRFKFEYIVTMKPFVKVTRAAQEQEQWTFAKLPKAFVAQVTTLVTMMDSEEAFSAIENVILTSEVNWKMILTATSAILVSKEKSFLVLKALVTRLLEHAFKKKEQEHLVCAFLLSRQASLEHQKFFHPYANWFFGTFLDKKHSLVNSVKSCDLLFKTLTSFVPYDPMKFLQSQISRMPSLPKDCRNVWDDYKALAKTRVRDLEARTSQQAAASKDAEIPREVAEEVKAAVIAFEKTGKIPSTVLSAHIFNNYYYTNKFLPALLMPRFLPKIPDGQMKLIDKLHSLGKIPLKTYESYLAGCRAMCIQEPQGEMEIDDQYDNQVSDIKDSLETLKLTFSTLEGLSESFLEETLLEYVLQVKDKIKACLEDGNFGSTCNVSFEEVEKAVLINPLHKKISQVMIDGWISLTDMINARPLPNWIKKYLSLLIPYPVLHRALYASLWKRIVGGEYSEEETVKGLASMVFELGNKQEQFLRIQTAEEVTTLVDMIFENFRIRSGQHMRSCFIFSSAYLREAVRSKREVSFAYESGKAYVSKFAAKKYLLLFHRFHWFRQTEPFQLECYNKVRKLCPLTFEEWLKFEYSVISHKDIFERSTDRLDYMAKETVRFSCGLKSDNVTFTTVSVELLQVIVDVLQTTACGEAVGANSEVFLGLLLQRVTSTREIAVKGGQESWFTSYWINSSLPTSDSIIFQIASYIPPWMLLTNKMKETPQPEAVERFLQLVNNRLRNSLNEGFCFSLSVTTRLLETLNPDDDKESELLTNFLAKCQCLKTSLLSHLPYMELPRSLQRLMHLNSWAEQIITTKPAQNHPEGVSSSELALATAGWLLKLGKQVNWNDFWEKFLSAVSKQEAGNLLVIFMARITGIHLEGLVNVLDEQHLHEVTVPEFQSSLGGILTLLTLKPQFIEALRPKTFSALEFFAGLPDAIQKLLSFICMKVIIAAMENSSGLLGTCNDIATDMFEANLANWLETSKYYFTSEDSVEEESEIKSRSFDIRLSTGLRNRFYDALKSAEKSNV